MMKFYREKVLRDKTIVIYICTHSAEEAWLR